MKSNRSRNALRVFARALQLVFLLLSGLVPMVLGGCAGFVSGANTTPPPTTTVNITNVQAISTTTSGTQIVWATDVASNSVVSYGTTISYGSSTPVDSTMVTTHQVAVSGLSAGTTYYFQVQSTDSKNNNGKSGGHKFATQGVSISGTITPSKGGAGATVTLSGTANATTTANGTGAYTFPGLASGFYAVTPSNTGYTFAPANQNVNAGTTDVTAVNFTASGTVVFPSVTTQPASQTVTAGQTATFSVVANGTAPLSYQWQKNGLNIAGATSATYTTPATTTSDNGSTFAVVVSNSAGAATSNAATLTVNAAPVAPTITAQPTNQTVTAGQAATFTVSATGTAPLSYQWQKNGANIAGATSTSYTTPATTTSDSGSTFVVVVSNSAGTATSSSATLTVNVVPVAPSITTQPTNQTVTTGQTATFSATAGGTAPLSYQWQKNGANISGATSAS
ncbi:MAG TPA: immunoglobulin domain-containing protein, partial [Candidatus Acidoferrum sp.]|nr:immunoglobulin domain-containing protein [Candidatus Acidoferrum sp.]